MKFDDFVLTVYTSAIYEQPESKFINLLKQQKIKFQGVDEKMTTIENALKNNFKPEMLND